MRVDAPPGTVGAERRGGVEVACAGGWILVPQMFREEFAFRLKKRSRLGTGWKMREHTRVSNHDARQVSRC